MIMTLVIFFLLLLSILFLIFIFVVGNKKKEEVPVFEEVRNPFVMQILVPRENEKEIGRAHV